MVQAVWRDHREMKKLSGYVLSFILGASLVGFVMWTRVQGLEAKVQKLRATNETLTNDLYNAVIAGVNSDVNLTLCREGKDKK